MSFTSTDFHDLLDPDIWVIEQFIKLPSDPEPKITRVENDVRIEIIDTVAMSQMQQAVSDYRRYLLPVIFIVSQKVYAEFFRFVLHQCGYSAGDRQYDIEKKVTMLITNNRILRRHPFTDKADFKKWWSEKYSFSVLRSARNQVVHSNYTFNGFRLIVNSDSGDTLIDWKQSEILDFAAGVLRISKQI